MNAKNGINVVQRFYHALGREDEFLPPSKKGDVVMERLTAESREKRAGEAAERLKKRKALFKKQAPPKHLHLKISQGMNDLPQRIKLKAEWLRITANAFVIGCVEGCLEAMDDPMKAFAPPPRTASRRLLFDCGWCARFDPRPEGKGGRGSKRWEKKLPLVAVCVSALLFGSRSFLSRESAISRQFDLPNFALI